ncbi:beta-N-acetylhexosaminidase [Agromyces sp. SYSU K20354]|uniref:family 20 glycosylhydrolase n=1 Tax=Agromyces cavernae TaxID=2898659 RepID=UPI001E533BFA|nr:family 20 glycosylhydrolase [Agromyces cavernae]MCD2441772.1 beta-N-acetylhexosaminidase [Agromyces cavernae]
MTGIVPAPASIEFHTTSAPFRIVDETRIVAAADVHAIAAALARDLRTVLGRELPVADATAREADISLVLHDGGEAGGESYTLDVSDRGIAIGSATPAGLYRATCSLRQLLPARTAAGASKPSVGDVVVPAVSVADAPRFAYRGVMLDVVRHFFAVEDVLRLIDALAVLKINILHLHLTDDQGWRIRVDSWPELTGIGGSTSVGGAGGGFYTKADYARIVDHAAERFITVVPEIDLPGHTNAALSAYPELNHDGVAREPYEGVEVGFSSLSARPERAEATDRFLSDVMREVAELTPGPWLHIGGDESMSTTAADYLDLVQRITSAAAATGKSVIGWHEIGASPSLPVGTIAQYWGYLEPQDDAARLTTSVVVQGGRVIMSPADVAYLDIQHAGSPSTPDGYELGLDWANGPTSLEDAYAWEPTAIIDGIGEQQILGVEAPIWTETARTIADVEFLVFPRVAAIAEIGWSPRPRDGARDHDEFAARVASLGAHWRGAGTVYCAVDGVPWEA